MKNSFLSILFLCFSITQAQQVSVLTCGRGQEIYSTFGHSAIRVKDSLKGTDEVYNYGLFDFQDPKFIVNFINGYLNYMVGKESYSDFIFQYQYQNRSVSEQILDLDSVQTKRIINFLEWNIKEENKYYRYDFLNNNCATKIIEVLKKANIKISETPFLHQKTYRNLIHEYASHSVPWIDWGMDVCLGYSCDKNTSRYQRCFLPDYVAQSLNISYLYSSKDKLVISNRTILSSKSEHNNNLSYYYPIIFSIVILIISIFFFLKQHKLRRYFYLITYLFLGLFGIVVLYEWFFTDHLVTKLNYNILWLNPLHLILAYGILVKKNTLIRFLIVPNTFCAVVCLILNITTNVDLHFASTIMVFSIIINGISIQKHIELK